MGLTEGLTCLHAKTRLDCFRCSRCNRRDEHRGARRESRWLVYKKLRHTLEAGDRVVTRVAFCNCWARAGAGGGSNPLMD